MNKGLSGEFNELVIGVLVRSLAVLAFLQEILELINSNLRDDMEDLGEFIGRIALHKVGGVGQRAELVESLASPAGHLIVDNVDLLVLLLQVAHVLLLLRDFRLHVENFLVLEAVFGRTVTVLDRL